MNFIEAIQSVVGNYVTFSGRATRSEFWYWQLFIFIINTILTTIHNHALSHNVELVGPFMVGSAGMLGKIFALIVLLPTLAVGVRRLHDSDHSGWWWLVAFLPVIGWIILIMLFIARGDDGGNQHGRNMWV